MNRYRGTQAEFQFSIVAPHTAHFSIAKDLAIDYRSQWTEVADTGPYKNPYRVGWEDFLRHVATGAPMKADFAAGIRDVQFADSRRAPSAAAG